MSSSISVQDLLATIKTVDKSNISETERQDLLSAAAELQAKVENPWDTVFRLVVITVSFIKHRPLFFCKWLNLLQPGVFTSVKTLLDLRLFEKWVAVGGGPKTVTELAKLVGAEEALLGIKTTPCCWRLRADLVHIQFVSYAS